MQSGSPFYHFESKAALLFAVMEQGMRAALRGQAQALQAPRRPSLGAPDGCCARWCARISTSCSARAATSSR